MYLQLSSSYRINYILLLYTTIGFCRYTALCRSIEANTSLLYCTLRCCTTVLHTQVMYHCTAHTGAVPLYCTNRCRTTVLHTQVLYTCYTHTIKCSKVLHRQVLYYCTAYTGAAQVPEYAKNKQVPNRTTLEKTSLEPTTPSTRSRSSRLFHPRRVASFEPCHYKRWQD